MNNNKKVQQSKQQNTLPTQPATKVTAGGVDRPKAILIKESWNPRGDTARYKKG
jgi:ABC-type sugar transport system ATPase subunit